MNRLILLLILIISFSNAQQATNSNVTKLYIATFDRAPDTQGLSYWVNSALSLEEIASSFFEQIETKALYPDGYSNYDFILAIYKNIFNREPDQEGGDYWQKRLNSGDISKALFILAVVNGAKGDDATLLDNKTEVGEEFVKSGSNDTLIAKNIMQNITTSRQTITDAFNEISNINVSGIGHTVIGGDNISGKGHTVTGDTTTIQYITNVYNNNEATDNTQITEVNKVEDKPSTVVTPQVIEHDHSEVFIDNETGLMWQDDYDARSVEKPWLTKANYDRENSYFTGNHYDTSGDTATTYCDNLSLGAYYDWRLPTKDQLLSLTTIEDELNNVSSSYYWSSTGYASGTSSAWVINFYFYDGFESYSDKGNSNFVRCVRTGL